MTGLFSGLTARAPDSLLLLMSEFRNDPRPLKIDLGLGVYRDDAGQTPIFSSVKAAERQLLEDQTTKAYLGPQGDEGYLAALQRIVLGQAADRDRVASIQTPGGTGALRLAFDLIARARPGACVWVSEPTWPVHDGIVQAARLAVRAYPYFDAADQRVAFSEMMRTLSEAKSGDVVLLHGCCHNPSGSDLSSTQWAELVQLLASKALIPLIDLAYHGLGRGLDADLTGVEQALRGLPEILLAYSCDKNFGLYRERTGALFVLAASAREAGLARSNLQSLSRYNWSMPPDHGAAVVRTILESDPLRAEWRAELDGMRARIGSVRCRLAAMAPELAFLGQQVGIFSLLPIQAAGVQRLRQEFGVYMAASGRVNVTGLRSDNLERFVRVFRECMRSTAANAHLDFAT